MTNDQAAANPFDDTELFGPALPREELVQARKDYEAYRKSFDWRESPGFWGLSRPGEFIIVRDPSED
jgi:hypothetical protein